MKRFFRMMMVSFGIAAAIVFVVTLAAVILVPKDSGEAQGEPTIAERLGADFDQWNSAYRPLIELTKDSMNNPSSFEHAETRFREMDDGDSIYVVMTFRGENAFGGTVTQQIEAVADIGSGEILSAQMVE